MAKVSKNLTRQSNEKNVLQDVMNTGPTSRSQVAKDLKLNKVTVSDIFSQLLADGYLEELGEGEGSQAGGRKPTMHRFNPHFGYVVSFDLGYHDIDMIISGLDGQISLSKRFWVEGESIQDRLALMLKKIQEYQAAPLLQTRNGLLGVAVGIHGIVSNNRISNSPFLAIESQDIGGFFSAALKVPVILENEANLVAMYARDFTSLAGTRQDLVALSVHKGLGAGVIINGRLFRGAHGGAGEVGRSFIVPDAGGQLVKIETLCSEDAVMAQLRAATGTAMVDEHAVQARWAAKDPKVQAVLAKFTDNLAIVVHNLLKSYDPQTVVVNSLLTAEIPPLLDAIDRRLQGFGDHVEMALCPNADHAVTLGGTALIVHQVLGMGSRQLHFRAH